MRFALPLTFLFVTLAPAAPVPVDKAAEAKQFDALWKDLETYDPVVRTKAVFALLDHPRAVEFLAGKVPPLDASADQLKGWLTDLNSDDEKVWKAAFEKLQYFDPRTRLTLAEQIALVTTDAGRLRLVGLWWDQPAKPNGSQVVTSFSIEPADPSGQSWNLTETSLRFGSTNVMKGTLGPVAEIAPTRWRQAAIAAHILRRINTKASRAVLERLAAGHKDALPTRTAVELLKALAPTDFKKDWDGLLSGEPLQATGWALSLRDRPDDVKRMAKELPAIKAEPDDVSAWLKALNDADPKVWKPAFEKLLYFRPLLAVPIDTQCKLMTTDHGRAALLHLTRFAPAVPDTIEAHDGSSLAIVNWRVELTYPAGGRVQIDSAHIESLDTMTPIHWQRARLAIIALERAKTDEAKAVLRQLADGHPDILPTKEAKAALDRLK